MGNTKLLVLCGGRSPEHQISLISAWNVCNKLQSTNIDLTLITINKNGQWFLQDIDQFLEQKPDATSIHFGSDATPVYLNLGSKASPFYLPETNSYLRGIDVVFPLLHGPNGEDGSIQGVLRNLQLPFIGPDVLGSAVCMDKVVAKQLMIQNQIPTSAFVVVSREQQNRTYGDIVNDLGLPLFIKPANLGSSVGISKVRNEEEFNLALEVAFQFDQKVIIEEFIEGIEVECAVLGNDELVVSPPGTYSHTVDFFDYDTKYINTADVVKEIPASQLTEAEQKEVMALSLKAYEACCCIGLARVDTFFTKDREFFVNEINTLPGFTQQSMYPMLMEYSGIAYNELIERLCNLARAHFISTNND